MKRLARLAIFVALAFVFFKLEIPYPVPNYEFLNWIWVKLSCFWAHGYSP